MDICIASGLSLLLTSLKAFFVSRSVGSQVGSYRGKLKSLYRLLGYQQQAREYNEEYLLLVQTESLYFANIKMDPASRSG